MSESRNEAEPETQPSQMARVHAMFRREFAMLPALVRGIAPGDRERVDVVGNHIILMTTILQTHHQIEDEFFWPRLRERGSAEVAALADELAAHHASLDEAVSEIVMETRTWRASVGRERGVALTHALDQMLSTLTHHMDAEEARGVPMIDRYVTAEEMSEAVQHGGARVPPEVLIVAMGMVLYYGTPGHFEPPAAMRPATQAFAIHAQRVHGTATPPKM